MNAVPPQTGFPIAALLLCCGVICFTAIQALIIAITGHRRSLYLVFSLLCLIAAGFPLFEYLYHTAATPNMVARVLQWRPVVGLLFVPVFFWFIALYSDLRVQQFRNWLVVLFAFSVGIICAHLVFGALVPEYSLLINLFVRLYCAAILIWGIYRITRMVQRGMWRAAIFLGAALALIFISFSVSTLIDMMFPNHIYFGGFAFLGLVLLMSVELSLDLRDRNRHIQYLAFHDCLTGLSNRMQLEERLDGLISSRDGSSKGGLLIIGLDNFKTINDALGHRIGDQLLKDVAMRLRRSCNKIAVAARMSGDDFALLLPQLGTDTAIATDNAQQAAEDVRQALSLPYALAGNLLEVGACIGFTVFPEVDETEVDILQRANLALHHAKLGGPGSIQAYTAGMQAEINEFLRMENALQRALENNEFIVHYQPQVTPSGDTVGAEALLRWRHPEEGFISPVVFIPVAERCGLIRPIGEWVLKQVCHYIADSDRLNPSFKGHLSVNVSAMQFMQKDYEHSVRRQIVASGIDPSRLTLEITESAFISDMNEAISKMESLRAMGLRFSIDDFGTGYASLSYLRRLPVQELKIDQSFVKNIGPDLRDVRLVRTIIEISRCMGLDVVAEGVETEVQRNVLASMNCWALQGHLTSPSMDGPAFLEWLRGRQATQAVHLANE